MSTKDNKPDLSNLKSRLGLSKSAGKTKESQDDEASSKSAGGASRDGQQNVSSQKAPASSAPQQQRQPQQAASAQPAQPAQPAEPAQPAQPAPRKAGPPPGAKGPPPTAMSSKEPKKAEPTPSRSVDLDATGVDDVGLEDLDGGSMFSPPVLVLFAVLAMVGIVFGFLAAQSNQTRAVEQTRIDDATALQERLEETVEEFYAAQEIIDGLDPMNVDFEAAEQLGELNFNYDPRFLPGNRILLGDRIVGPLHEYIADARWLHQLAVEHSRATTGADREELEAFISDREEALDEGDQVAVVFDLPNLQRHFIQDEEPSEYNPLKGRLVGVAEDAEPNDDGQIEVFVFAAGSSDRVDVRSLVPIVESDFLDIDTDNAMQRYSSRVAQMQDLADELDSDIERLMEAVSETAEADSPPLFTLRGASDPDEELEEIDDLPEADDGITDDD